MSDRETIPLPSIIFGYGPMLPFVAGALGVWLGMPAWQALALWLTQVWGALILSFVAGVRRGFAFERERASTPVEIATMIPYVVLAGLGVLLPPLWGVMALALGFALATLLDTRAAKRGNAPAFFARLRPTQFPIAVLSLLAIAARAVV
ncbi:DUF3429 domain-containing protein [Erythrobacter sp. LQ02-29]|uniref:DUF3429 domain-containing protein n=1 Tax=Erythrobacter sp. LQ02-29 TaxID=2920384 RepID=UPI001F4EEF3B|nr:DUF3429 domain-containing protein [Erythrobacter sp. LQ02-29]MCP9221675.1 DUF3429 domain-containing protein [Erythrobacter sp. LQ02-29]